MSTAAAAGGDMEAGFAKLQGEDFEYYMQTYSIVLGRNSKKSTVDVDLSSLGGGMNISRHHARIFYDFARRRFALEVLGKNGCLVEGVLHLPGNPPVKLDSQDLLQIGDKEFYFLLPVRSILGGPVGPRHYPNHATPGPVVPHYNNYHLGPGPVKKAPRREYYEEEFDDEDDVGGRKMRRDGYDGYGYAGGKSSLSAPMDKKSEGRSRVDRDADNLQLQQLEEKDVVSSVATVLSDLCGPGEWMPMEKLHTEKDLWYPAAPPRVVVLAKMALFAVEIAEHKDWSWQITLHCSCITLLMAVVASSMLDRRDDLIPNPNLNRYDFPITIDLHQGSTLSPYLFTLILDVLTEQIQEIAPRCMLFADDIVLLGESREELNERLETWKRALETHGFRLSRSKSEYMECKFNKRRRVSNSEVKIGDHIIPQVTRFKYLGSVIQDDGEIEGDVNHRIQAGWMKWRKASGVLCDAKVPIKLKEKFYRTAVRPTILYGTECWAVKSQHENKVGVAEMRMLRWMCGKTRQDKIRNETIRERVGVAPIVEKMVENRLRWFGHVERRPVDSVVRRVDQMERRQTIRGRGRPKKTIREVIKKDLELSDLDRSMLLEQYSSVWHHNRVRRYLTSEDWPGPESKGKPWYGLLMLLRKYPEHFVINTRSKGRVTHEFVSLVSLLS
ncbi:FHA domain-containing protein FHA2 [Glycine soja]